MLNSTEEKTPKTKINDLCKRLKQLDLPKTPENLLTPNHTHFNLKSASPFLVDIKCRHPINKQIEAIAKEEMQNRLNGKSNENGQKEIEVIEISSDSDDDDATEVVVRKNLFELTVENLEKHLSMTPKKNRISLVSSWRDKVNKSRRRQSILPVNELDLDSFIMKHAVNAESTTIFSKSNSVDTVKAAEHPEHEINERRNQFSPNSETNESFFTAPEPNGAHIEKDLGLECNQDAINEKYSHESEIIFQTQEKYQHVDVENNVIFYEHKLLAKPVKVAPSELSDNGDDDDVIDVINTTSESGTCTALPTDYDTDDLRKELKYFGDVPGPITKSTKRLYLKRLVRYKRKPKRANNHQRGKSKSMSHKYFHLSDSKLFLFIQIFRLNYKKHCEMCSSHWISYTSMQYWSGL